MLSETEYNQLVPHKDLIKRCYDSQSFGKAANQILIVIDRIRQAHQMGALCYNCTGSVMNALNDAMSLIKEYEENSVKTA